MQRHHAPPTLGTGLPAGHLGWIAPRGARHTVTPPLPSTPLRADRSGRIASRGAGESVA